MKGHNFPFYFHFPFAHYPRYIVIFWNAFLSDSPINLSNKKKFKKLEIRQNTAVSSLTFWLSDISSI